MIFEYKGEKLIAIADVARLFHSQNGHIKRAAVKSILLDAHDMKKLRSAGALPAHVRESSQRMSCVDPAQLVDIASAIDTPAAQLFVEMGDFDELQRNAAPVAEPKPHPTRVRQKAEYAERLKRQQERRPVAPRTLKDHVIALTNEVRELKALLIASGINPIQHAQPASEKSESEIPR